MESLLELEGCDVNYQKSKTLLTPLHWAAYNNDYKVCNKLIEKGAKLRFNSMMESPLSIAGNA